MNPVPQPSNKRVLVVDDEPGIVRLLQANLERLGLTVETAENGVEALSKVMAAYPDLLITDIMMPEMDGLELVEHVRRHPDLRDLPVVLLTQRTDERTMTAGYTRGADMYLNKPFNPSELGLIVRRLLFPGENTSPDAPNGAD